MFCHLKKAPNEPEGRRHLDFCLGGPLLILTVLLLFFCSSFRGQEGTKQDVGEREVRQFLVAADQGWIDTGWDVVEGQEIYFEATGVISLQKGNPMAFCGPNGYNLQTVQQPIRDKNIGALIGRIVFLVSVEIDEETGEETRNELIEEFYIGEKNRIKMLLSGRLFLGINENVVGDNSGEYKVLVYLLGEKEET